MGNSESGDNNCMGEAVRPRLKSCGANVKIYPLAKIVNPGCVEVGEYSMIDDFTFINGGLGTTIGRYVHVAAFSCIIGGGCLEVEDYVVIGYGARIITGTDSYKGGKRMTTALPEEHRNVQRSRIVIKKDAFIGTNAVVHPGIEIGEGAIIGSGAVVTKDIEPWTINVGVPCRRIGYRPRVTNSEI
jgi:acetyltransferase-like isoleucine patch superfamily enzyme